MKLNIYNGKKIVKTYEADTYDLMFGTLEDVANAIKLDEMKSGTDEEILRMAFNLIASSLGTVRELLKDIFDGITEEEMRMVKVKEIAQVLFDVVRYTIEQLGKGISTRKN